MFELLEVKLVFLVATWQVVLQVIKFKDQGEVFNIIYILILF